MALLTTALLHSQLMSDLQAETAARPNVILFLADDLGWNGLGCYGSDYHQTPNVDALAKQGVKFTDAYSACTVCSPSRAAIMTGKYPARLHLTDFIAGQNQPFAKLAIPDWTKGMRHEEVTLAEALGAGGYKTAHVGKWHLNFKGPEASKYQPVNHGFDLQIMKPAAKGYFMTRPAGKFDKGDFTTDYFASEAAKIVRQWKDEPFFLYFSFDVPHTPIQGKKELVEKYRATADPNATHSNPVYAAMIQSMDEAVGTVLESVRANGIEDRTVVIFTSDNGGLSHKFRSPTGITWNDPLRRGKGSAYEGGTRVPMIVRWPEVAPRNTLCSEPVIGNDLYPTILEIAGAKGDPKHSTEVDGQSFLTVIKKPTSTLDRDAIFWHHPHYHAGGFSLPGKPSNGPYSAIRSRQWKLIEYFEDERVELYDLERDIREANDLAATQPEKTTELRKKLAAWRESVGAQLPTANPNYDPVKAEPKAAR